jgi:hypothetical protein
MQIQPCYTPDHCSAAYQLNWSLSLFGRESLPTPANTVEELRSALAVDYLKIQDSPMEVALVLLNNMAFTQGMKPIFRSSFYVGTFGEYDRGAIWNGMTKQTDE